MTTQAQLRTQTSPCRNGCGTHVHYGSNPDGGIVTFLLPLRGWTLRPSGRPGYGDWRGVWVEHFSLDYGSCFNRPADARSADRG